MVGQGKRFVGVVLCLAALVAACGGEADGDPVERLEEMGTLRYLIAAPTDGGQVLASQDDETLMPLASVFKLYVLGALVEAVDAGGITWDDPVRIRDELVSLGEGPMAEEEPGSMLPVRQLALWMIRESDNTATDHLMDLVGREAVEQIQLEMGHSEPTVNMPGMTTRELTILLWSESDVGERYSAAGASERWAILEDEVANLPLPAGEQTDTLVYSFPYSIGWLGTTGDACRALAWLMEDDEARAILTNRPLSPNPDLWPMLGFKGGWGNSTASTAMLDAGQRRAGLRDSCQPRERDESAGRGQSRRTDGDAARRDGHPRR